MTFLAALCCNRFTAAVVLADGAAFVPDIEPVPSVVVLAGVLRILDPFQAG
jgi:hypothetical protein